jgi:hypothetical protein
MGTKSVATLTFWLTAEHRRRAEGVNAEIACKNSTGTECHKRNEESKRPAGRVAAETDRGVRRSEGDVGLKLGGVELVRKVEHTTVGNGGNGVVEADRGGVI